MSSLSLTLEQRLAWCADAKLREAARDAIRNGKTPADDDTVARAVQASLLSLSEQVAVWDATGGPLRTSQ